MNSQNLRLALGQVTRGFSGPGRVPSHALCFSQWHHEKGWALTGGISPVLVSPAVMMALVRTDLKGLGTCHSFLGRIWGHRG